MNSLAFKLVDGVLTIYLRQDIDHHTAAEIRRGIDDEIAHAMPLCTVLNFSEVEFMDSSGVGLVMGRLKLMSQLGGELKLAGVNRVCERILDLSGILEIVEILK
ncbi:MAG: anti-sigma factor antagonist [Ruminococcaceae bacterium]|nr:anti-sigma factor antagonist [Oscillospiraceae bacterium]